MFGDVLTKEQCVEIVRRLAGCKRGFICAHGRPCVAALAGFPGRGI